MDLITDILSRVAALRDQDEFKQLAEIERQVRHDWGGDRVYIPRAGESSQKSSRDEAILRDMRRGERVAYIARKHGISPRRVRQILREKAEISLP